MCNESLLTVTHSQSHEPYVECCAEAAGQEGERAKIKNKGEVRTCVVRLLAAVNEAAQWGHAWSLRFSCTVRTCFVRLFARPNAAAQWGHA
jgi:hypothetical protein